MNILHIDSSPRRESHSRGLSAAIVQKLLKVAPGASISRRDLGFEPLPHPMADYAATLASPATLAAPLKGSLDVSEALIREVEAADVIVIGTPMHNYTIPSVLKAWIDQILRVGRTMKSTPAGKVGMLRDRPVFIGVASGGVFSGDRANQPDFLTQYLSLALNSIGLKTLQFLPVQATAFLDHDQAASAREKALAAIDLTVMGECCTGSSPTARRKLLARPHHNLPALARTMSTRCLMMSRADTVAQPFDIKIVAEGVEPITLATNVVAAAEDVGVRSILRQVVAGTSRHIGCVISRPRFSHCANLADI